MIEDKIVAERAFTIWPNITKYVSETLKRPKSKTLVPVTFTAVMSAVHNHLMVAKLQFFISVATVMQPYLQKFQADAPLLPFVTTEIVSLLENFMHRFVEQNILKSTNSPPKIAKLNVSDAAIQVKPADIDVGFTVTGTLAGLLRQKKVSD